MTIKLSSIVAVAQNHVIGRNNELLWHIPEDFKHFKRTTMGCPLIMGRKTFESLPGILPGRPHIVISRSATPLPKPSGSSTPSTKNQNNENTSPSPELCYVKLVAEGIALGKEVAENNGTEEAFIIGGGEIYKQTLPLIDRLYLTIVHKDYDGDTFFPEFNWDEWSVISEEKHEGNPGFTFFTLERK